MVTNFESVRQQNSVKQFRSFAIVLETQCSIYSDTNFYFLLLRLLITAIEQPLFTSIAKMKKILQSNSTRPFMEDIENVPRFLEK